MKRFYVTFFLASVVIFALLYFSIWWFIAGIGCLLIFLAYRVYAFRLQASETKNEGLEKKVEGLYLQLDHSILKEQKTNREAEHVKALKHELLTILSHEIRTPMNGVMGMSLLLADTFLTKEQKEYNDTIRRCGENLLTTVNNILVNDILAFSKLDLESEKLNMKDFDLRNCVEEVLEMFAAKAGVTGLDLVYYIDENVPEQVLGDNKRIRQVLMNLVENAVKFTQQGEVFVGIRSSDKWTGNQPQLIFEVRDSGTGIADNQLKQLFKGIPGKEVNQEADPQTTGLGLVICRKLVELMKGEIRVESKLGQGSKFTFTLPMVSSLKINHEQAHQNKGGNLENKKVLIVDDNPTSRDALVKLMASWKIVPIGAASGEQALEIILQHRGKIDLVITDKTLPVMDGILLSGSVKDKYPAMPVILMNPSGNGLYNLETELFSSILPKPVKKQALMDQLLAAFSQTPAEKQQATDKLQATFSQQFPLRILVAEDNPINQKLAMKILSKLGYQPGLANNGKEAIEMISQEHYDIILMDVQMPEMNGLEATRMIRTCLEVQPIIIALTANAMQGDRDECMQAGMDDYISKPIELKELLRQFEKWSHVLKDKKNQSRSFST